MENTGSILEKIDVKLNVFKLFISMWELNSNTDHIYDRSSKNNTGF